MEKENQQMTNTNNQQTDNDAIMNRVNQTFDKIAQDVKDMINENNQMS
ncbi:MULTISPECIES: hypothetical protein [Bacillaceae]|nr:MULTISPECIES: hypothetical protein [Bacillaceae]MCM3764737.1 hypothetical protein [Neobacillus niacini]